MSSAGSVSIRAKLLLLLLIVFLPATGIIIASGLERRAHDIEEATNGALLLVESLSDQQEQIVIGTKQMLSTLSQLPEVQRRDAEACSDLFRKLREQYPFYSTITATTPEGDVFASSNPFDPTLVNLSDRKHIRDAIRTLDFSAGEYIVGRISKVPSINYTYPILSGEKDLIGILVAGFKLGEFTRFIKKVNLPEGSAVVITDQNGARLYRMPENEAAPVGASVREASFEQMSGKAQGGVFEATGADGIYRIYAFKQLRLREGLTPYLYVVVGIPKEPILQHANRGMLRSLSILGLIALTALTLAWFLGNRSLAKPINQLVMATRQLAGGEMGTRTGLPHTPDELGRLARAFDDMASQLEVRIAEQEKAKEALQESEEWFRAFFENVAFGAAAIDLDGRFVNVNERLCRITGYEKAELLGMSPSDLTHPADLDLDRKSMTCYLQGRTNRYDAEKRYIRKDGEVIWVQISARMIFDSDGQPECSAGIILDITKQKRMEEALRESERFNRSTVNALSANLAILDENGFILCTNRSWQEFGRSNGLILDPELTGVNYLTVCDEASGKWAEEAPLAASGIRDVISGRRDRWQMDYPCHSPDEKRWFSMRVTRFEGCNPVRVVVAHENVTEQREAEESMRLLPSRLLAAQEEERKRLAHELHDSIGGALSSVKLNLETTLTLMEDGVATPDCIRDLLGVTARAIEDSRRIYANLRPSLLDDLGIIPTLGWFCREYEALHSGIEVEKHIEVTEDDVPEDLKIVIFRVVQEAFHNLAKYSQADLVTASLRRRYSSLELAIADNGVGFDTARVSTRRGNKGGLGLTSMRERVELSGGSFRIESSKGEGTLVRACWDTGRLT